MKQSPHIRHLLDEINNIYYRFLVYFISNFFAKFMIYLSFLKYFFYLITYGITYFICILHYSSIVFT